MNEEIKHYYTKIPKKEAQCLFCENIFLGKDKAKYCSQTCNVMYNRYKKTKKELHHKKCKWCKNDFIALRFDDKYCCSDCASKYRKQTQKGIRNKFEYLKNKKKKCAWCNNEFSLKRASQRCCSQYCYEKYYNKFNKNNIKKYSDARKRATEKYWRDRNKIKAKQYNISINEYIKITAKCYFCSFDEIVDCHHIKPLSQGGENKIENYIGLCPNHHKLIHLRKYYLIMEDEKWKLMKPLNDQKNKIL